MIFSCMTCMRDCGSFFPGWWGKGHLSRGLVPFLGGDLIIIWVGKHSGTLWVRGISEDLTYVELGGSRLGVWYASGHHRSPFTHSWWREGSGAWWSPHT